MNCLAKRTYLSTFIMPGQSIVDGFIFGKTREYSCIPERVVLLLWSQSRTIGLFFLSTNCQKCCSFGRIAEFISRTRTRERGFRRGLHFENSGFEVFSSFWRLFFLIILIPFMLNFTFYAFFQLWKVLCELSFGLAEVCTNKNAANRTWLEPRNFQGPRCLTNKRTRCVCFCCSSFLWFRSFLLVRPFLTTDSNPMWIRTSDFSDRIAIGDSTKLLLVLKMPSRSKYWSCGLWSSILTRLTPRSRYSSVENGPGRWSLCVSAACVCFVSVYNIAPAVSSPRPFAEF